MTIRISASTIPLLLLVAGWILQRTDLVLMASVASILYLIGIAILAGFEAMNENPDAFGIAGAFTLMGLIWFGRVKAVQSLAIKGDPSGFGKNLVGILGTMQVLNLIICVLAVLLAVAKHTSLFDRLEPKSSKDGVKGNGIPLPPVIPQDELDRREATKKVLAELRAESWKS